MTTTYEAWRITYQSSEQAARAAFEQLQAATACKTCPVTAGTHKPADAVHTEIAEPAGETHLRELTAYRTTVDNLEAESSTLRARCAAQHEALMQAQAGLEFAVAFRRGQGCAVNEDPAKGFVLSEVLALQFVNSVLDGTELEAKAQGCGQVKANCYSIDGGDSWRDCPDDFDFVEGLKVGDLFDLQASIRSWSERFRVMRSPDETSDDYEVELVSSDAPVHQSSAPSPAVPAPQASMPAVTKEGKSYEQNFVAPQAPLAAIATGPCGQCKDSRQPCACQIATMLKERGLVAVDANHYAKVSARAKATGTPAAGVSAAEAVPAPDARDALDDTALLDFIQSESWDLRSIDMPTGAGDSDVHWQVIEHHMAAPHEREVGRSYSDDPREAIRDAVGRLTNIAAQAKGEQA